MNGLSILGTGRSLPDHIVTNDDLARRVETSNDWIVSRTGIRERRFAQGETLTQLAVAAARRAMERAGVGPQDIGLCLMAPVTPDWITPSQACLLHQELGLPEDCPAFDLSAGCTGFLYAMETAAAMLPRMARPCALLVGGELLSRITDMDDRSTCILFGDGAGAAVVKSTEGAPWHALLGTRGNREALWAALRDGEIQTVATDHCSFTLDQKLAGKDDFTRIPGGLPGVEDRGTLLWSAGVAAGRISEADMCRVLCENPARLYGCWPRKGVIAPGSDADIVVLDPAAESVLTAADHVQNVDYTPYEGTPLCGGIAQVYLRGRLAVDGGRLMEELPAGAFIPRGKCQL